MRAYKQIYLYLFFNFLTAFKHSKWFKIQGYNSYKNHINELLVFFYIMFFSVLINFLVYSLAGISYSSLSLKYGNSGARLISMAVPLVLYMLWLALKNWSSFISKFQENHVPISWVKNNLKHSVFVSVGFVMIIIGLLFYSFESLMFNREKTF